MEEKGTGNLVVKYSPKVDEMFKQESKKTLLTNTDYDWTGAHTVNVWKMSTAEMNDYKRNVFQADDNEVARISRYGAILDLTSQVEEMMLKKDRSFIFNIDAMDTEETGEVVGAASALGRQIREVVIPEVDTYTYGVMVSGAGTTKKDVELSEVNIYDEITDGTEILDDNEVPETDRVLVVVPKVYKYLKKSVAFDHTEISAEMKKLGVVGYIDGMAVVKIAAARLPENFGFMIAHPSATTAPTKLEDYHTHLDTPLASGAIVTGRIVYDAFVLENKKKGLYYHTLNIEK